jgi:stage V sporulation protein AA
VPVVHIKPRADVTVPVGVDINLGMLAEVAADEADLERRLRGTPAVGSQQPDAGAVVVSALDLVRLVRQVEPGADVRLIGPDMTLVRTRIRQSPLLARAWMAAVSVVLFFGGMMAIMFFHADVEMATVHRALGQMITGVDRDRTLWLTVPYSIGTGLGVLFFFNHLSRRKPSSDPSPLDVQMYKYDRDTAGYLTSQGTPFPEPEKEKR